MIKITKVTVQKRIKGRYNLFIDRGAGEEYGFSVDEAILLKYGLKKGLELEENELTEVIEKDEEKKTHHLALNFLSYRMRSIHEMEEYLTKKERHPEHVERVISKLIELKFLNDQEFSKAYVESKKLTLLKGPMKLRQELMQKGVGPQYIAEALETFPEEEQVEKMIKWLEKKEARKPKQSLSSFKQKLATQLMAKGFSRQAIQLALNEVTFTVDNSEELEALMFQGDKLKRKYSTKYEGWEYKQRMKQALYQKGFSLDMISTYLSQEQEDE
ncbi:recombination regulator RecX [Bacillus sp. FJAT-45037]|uniref:recombination regulator RecX n=1 Tax=Bacillus sp. FJAT-45037 TaxID=2011007 RepID=UPI000C23491F|nr:recombination regulator RecX [Bacillus sp. FJAT-45037]